MSRKVFRYKFANPKNGKTHVRMIVESETDAEARNRISSFVANHHGAFRPYGSILSEDTIDVDNDQGVYGAGNEYMVNCL